MPIDILLILYSAGVSNVRVLADIPRIDALVVVIWDPAHSPYCGEVLYYQVVISSDEHVDISNSIVNVTDLNKLSAVFTGLMNNTVYNVSVTPYNRIGGGLSVIEVVTDILSG